MFKQFLIATVFVGLCAAQSTFCEASSECAAGEECDTGSGSNGYCTDGKVGSYCQSDTTCKDAATKCLSEYEGYVSSIITVSTAGLCLVPIDNGGVCDESYKCASKFCTGYITQGTDTGVCKARSASGAACTDDNKSEQKECESTLYCTAVESGKTVGTCATLKKTGEACTAAAECEGGCDTIETNQCTLSGDDVLKAVGTAFTMIIGIAVGGVVLCCCCCAAIWFFVLKGRK